jgi:hypothetical protein
LNEDEDVSRDLKMGGLFMAVLLISFVCGWLIILLMNYHNTYDLTGGTMAWWGRYQFRAGEDLMLSTLRGSSPNLLADRLPGLLGGATLALACYTLCQFFPLWPLHPIGLLGMGTWCVNVVWPSIFMGWLLKTLIIRYGGARLYSRAKNMFMGLVVGEVMAVLFWSAIAAILALSGRDYVPINILPS